MILNDVISINQSPVVIYGAPNESLDIIDLNLGLSYVVKLDSNGEGILDSLPYSKYLILGSKSKEAIPDGRITTLSDDSNKVSINNVTYRIMTAYPDITFFWYGREIAEWKGNQTYSESKPFSNYKYTKNPDIESTAKVDKDNGRLVLSASSSSTDKIYCYTGYIKGRQKCKGQKRGAFIAESVGKPGTNSLSYVGLAYQSGNNEEITNNGYTYFLNAEVKDKQTYMVNLANYQGQTANFTAFIANNSSVNGTLMTNTIYIYAAWLDDVEVTSNKVTEKVNLSVYRDTLRSDIALVGGNAWTKANYTNSNYENYFGRSSTLGSYGGSASNSSMAIPLKFNFTGRSTKLIVTCNIYSPYSPPFEFYWAITGINGLTYYSAKDVYNIAEVTNDPYCMARGEYALQHGGQYKEITMEFPCTRIPSNQTFYLIFYSKPTTRKGAAHARGTLSAYVQYGWDS